MKDVAKLNTSRIVNRDANYQIWHWLSKLLGAGCLKSLYFDGRRAQTTRTGGHDSARNFSAVVMSRGTMTGRFLMHVTAGQWIFSRLDDVPITALSQYDRPWSFMNEARVTTRGYCALEKGSSLFTALKRSHDLARDRDFVFWICCVDHRESSPTDDDKSTDSIICWLEQGCDEIY